MSVSLTRSSVAAIKAESTSGTPVLPTGATDFIALQDGNFEIEPNFNVLENGELKSSIGKSQSLLGLEEPSASISHYVRHSGVEGTEPNYGELLSSAFGAKSVNGTQYDTVSGSSAGTSSARGYVVVDSGEGANFSIGEGLLIKDGTNVYSMRAVHSISTDNLNLSFNLSAAPASGVNLGKAVMYYPASTGHTSVTLALYRGNGHSTEVMAGGRVAEFNLEANAGEYINGSYSLEGTEYFFDPIEITSSSKYLDFLDNATTRVATMTEQLYKDPIELADEIAAKMNGLGSANTFTCTYSSTTGKYTITSNGTTLTLKWNTGANTANSIATKIGFTTAADSSAALTYTSANALSFAAPYTPSYDSASPLVAKSNEVMIGSYYDYACFCAQTVSFTLSNEIQKVPCVCADSGITEAVAVGREATVELTALIDKWDAAKFAAFRQGSTVSFQYNFGTKSGTNWVAGKCGLIYIKDATITAYKMEDSDGVIAVSMTVTGYVDSSGNGEVFLNFL